MHFKVEPLQLSQALETLYKCQLSHHMTPRSDSWFFWLVKCSLPGNVFGVFPAMSSDRINLRASAFFHAFCTVVPPKDSMAIERSNLLSMLKLSIRVLIQSSMSLGRTLDSEYPPLQQFFVVLEHCLKHGLKG